MDMQDAPQLAGIHHLKLPVADLARSREWYETRPGYRVQIEFVEQGQLMGYARAPQRGPAAQPAAQPGTSQDGTGL